MEIEEGRRDETRPPSFQELTALADCVSVAATPPPALTEPEQERSNLAGCSMFGRSELGHRPELQVQEAVLGYRVWRPL
jgi:hypothetical protein